MISDARRGKIHSLMPAYMEALVGVMPILVVAALSLMVSILAQMVSTLLNHRGGNLLWGLKTLFSNLNSKRYPRLSEQATFVGET